MSEVTSMKPTSYYKSMCLPSMRIRLRFGSSLQR